MTVRCFVPIKSSLYCTRVLVTRGQFRNFLLRYACKPETRTRMQVYSKLVVLQHVFIMKSTLYSRKRPEKSAFSVLSSWLLTILMATFICTVLFQQFSNQTASISSFRRPPPTVTRPPLNRTSPEYIHAAIVLKNFVAANFGGFKLRVHLQRLIKSLIIYTRRYSCSLLF